MNVFCRIYLFLFIFNAYLQFTLQVLDALELAFKELDSEDSAVMDDTPKKIEEDVDFVEKKITVAPLYENMDIFYQNSDEPFPLDMNTNVLEPPKEKPPPPPTDDLEDELLGNVSFIFPYLYHM